MGILASPGDVANGCAANEDPTQGQQAAARTVADRQGGRVKRSGVGLGQHSSRRPPLGIMAGDLPDSPIRRNNAQ